MAVFKLPSLSKIDWNDHLSSKELFLTTETETSEIKLQQEHDIIWCHDLMNHSQIMLSITQGVMCRALTFQYALYILRNQQLNFSNNFNSFLFQLRNRAVQDNLS